MNDVSSKVRAKVADVCERLNYTEMVGGLENQYNIENDELVKKRLIFALRLLKDGYMLEEFDTDSYELLLKTDEGLMGTTIPKDKLKNHQIDAILRSIQQKGKLPWE